MAKLHVRSWRVAPCDNCGKYYEESQNKQISGEHTSQLMAKCMCEAGAARVEQKKSRPGRRAVPLGGPLRLDRSSRFCEKIYPLVSQIVEDLGRRNPRRA